MISATEIARRLSLPEPTAEQRAVIEAEPRGRSLVVAGAGSGKTETMAHRVVWLVANGHVKVSEVLGLTFTRKAAAELAERVRTRIAQLVAAGIADVDVDLLDSAEIATYNSFASTIYREHAILIGCEPDAAVLSEASAWQLVREIVAASDDMRLAALDRSLDHVTGDVLMLSRELAEHVADVASVRKFVASFGALADLPIGNPKKRGPYESCTRSLAVVGALKPLLDLAEAYRRAKFDRGFVEFSDQIALALEICDRNPDVVADYRSRFRVVLLDEYQDTSVVQTRLLARLFRDHPVMAVGDPDQSIYGWRGASAANLGRFHEDFGTTEGGRTYDLSTSWRNPPEVLDAANTIVAPFRSTASVPKRPLSPSPIAVSGSVDLVWRETIEDEADAVAEWFQESLANSPSRSAAMLLRSLKIVEPFAMALARRGVPYHVLGLAGLLDQPVIADLVATLRVVHDPTAGSELVRILAGARWNIGVRDIQALRDLARRLAERDFALRPLEGKVRERLRSSADPDESASLVDALDFVAGARPDHPWLTEFSEAARERMRSAGAQLRALRRRAGDDLVDVVALVQRECLLDIEIAANESQPLGQPSLEAFDDLLAGFLSVSDTPSLGAFLSWLQDAEERDRLSPRMEDPEAGTVQLLTIHGSKGLEWDLVAVPRMVDGELPGPPLNSRGWLTYGCLPYQFRGDCVELPELAWEGVHDQREFDDAFNDFVDQVKTRHAEELRRLAYVALTRSRCETLLSGSWWATQKTPRGPSAYLFELVAAGVLPSRKLPETSAHEENPRASGGERVTWPFDPLGARRERVELAAASVRRALVEDAEVLDPLLRTDLERVLEEWLRNDVVDDIRIPARIPASRFKDYVDDPKAVIAQQARPMPQRPFRATRLGTLFHSWVEHRSTGPADAVDDDFDRGEPDLGDAVELSRLERLKTTFDASRWGSRRPLEVECEIHLPIGRNVFVCKIDAVYEIDDAAGRRFEIVDWKTGKRPSDERERQLRQTQLALYRLAFARWKGIDIDLIDAVFYFVEDDAIVRPDRLYDEAELRELWASVIEESSSPASGVDAASAA